MKKLFDWFLLPCRASGPAHNGEPLAQRAAPISPVAPPAQHITVSLWLTERTFEIAESK
jgi:hypothetical protein